MKNFSTVKSNMLTNHSPPILSYRYILSDERDDAPRSASANHSQFQALQGSSSPSTFSSFSFSIILLHLPSRRTHFASRIPAAIGSLSLACILRVSKCFYADHPPVGISHTRGILRQIALRGWESTRPSTGTHRCTGFKGAAITRERASRLRTSVHLSDACAPESMEGESSAESARGMLRAGEIERAMSAIDWEEVGERNG